MAALAVLASNRTSVWDSQNRLASCTYNGVSSTFTYAADGLRHRMVSGGATTDYVLDAGMFVRELRNGPGCWFGTPRCIQLTDRVRELNRRRI